MEFNKQCLKEINAAVDELNQQSDGSYFVFFVNFIKAFPVTPPAPDAAPRNHDRAQPGQ